MMAPVRRLQIVLLAVIGTHNFYYLFKMAFFCGY